MFIRKTLTAFAAGLMLASLAVAPAFAHKVKQNQDSNTIVVTGTVVDECRLSTGNSYAVTLTPYLPISNTGGTGSDTLAYTCSNGGTTNPVILFNDNSGSSWDCTATGQGANLYFYIAPQDGSGGGPNGQVGCNGTAGWTGPSGSGSGSEQFNFAVDLSAGSNQSAPVGTYTDSVTVNLTP
jgi:hypothetical protein